MPSVGMNEKTGLLRIQGNQELLLTKGHHKVSDEGRGSSPPAKENSHDEEAGKVGRMPKGVKFQLWRRTHG